VTDQARAAERIRSLEAEVERLTGENNALRFRVDLMVAYLNRLSRETQAILVGQENP
jgi:hypothetical protein